MEPSPVEPSPGGPANALVRLRDRLARFWASRATRASRVGAAAALVAAAGAIGVAAYLGMLGVEEPATKMKFLRLVQGMDIVETNNIRARMKK